MLVKITNSIEFQPIVPHTYEAISRFKVSQIPICVVVILLRNNQFFGQFLKL